MLFPVDGPLKLALLLCMISEILCVKHLAKHTV